MSLPADLEADLTNPADEIPDSQFVPEEDPAFDADPLDDATGLAPAESKGWIAAIVVVVGLAVLGMGFATATPGELSLLVVVGGIVLLVGIALFFIL